MALGGWHWGQRVFSDARNCSIDSPNDNETTNQSIDPNRTARCYRNYCYSGGDAAAGVEQRKVQGASYLVHEQLQAAHARVADVPRG